MRPRFHHVRHRLYELQHVEQADRERNHHANTILLKTNDYWQSNASSITTGKQILQGSV